MHSRNAVGQFNLLGESTVLTVKASGALAYGDVVILGTQDDGGVTVVAQCAADDTNIVGVICTRGGIADGDLGEMVILGWAEVRVASATYGTPGQNINTNGGGAGYGAAGTAALGKVIGYAIGDGTGAETLIKVWVNPH